MSRKRWRNDSASTDVEAGRGYVASSVLEHTLFGMPPTGIPAVENQGPPRGEI
jgi:hypothetical protein